MKVLKVSEVSHEINQLIRQKQQEKEQILAVRDAVNKIIHLDDALKGEGGEAIKEHFATLHIPAILLLHQFLHQYLDILKDILTRIEHFETNNGFISEQFIETEVKTNLNQLENFTEETVNSINQYFFDVADLVHGIPVQILSFQNSMISAKNHAHITVDALAQLDENISHSLTSMQEQLAEIRSFTQKLHEWTKGGVFLSKEQIKEIENYISETDTFKKMIDEAIELSVQEGDSTFVGAVAEWLDSLGKFNGGLSVAKGLLAVHVLGTGLLTLTKDAKGNFIIKASPAWVKGANKKYESKLAERIYQLLEKGDKNSNNIIKRALAKYHNTPSGVLRELIGLHSKTNRISFGKIVTQYHKILVFDESLLKQYKVKVDIKSTIRQFTDVKSFSKLIKRLPLAGVWFSLGTNAGEFFSDENQYKSLYEKFGRFSAGLGLDVGVAATTSAGAYIGSLIAPGPGTIIGGAIGAGVGIVGSWLIEDAAKDFGEKVGREIEKVVQGIKEGVEEVGKEIEEGIENVTEMVSDSLANAEKFIADFFN
ncbi:ribonuclease YeeF family protein [Parageobacillus thermoglucosidasius]|uniref:Transposase n=1 Tax=Parageobacillus thermoglucosidasius TaxID=1426 RepID=A0AAN0YNG9_PARTM|nr:LXG domain-containing protein [Parageobacillus thermoglucosidasius]ALF10389.1 transposase [Parageobacillus thermoglucosidasius]ANZ30470.1 transposase [Parageobacillus thermoglucosidasius]APM81208.1 transposase [Parageobacillus thermoglucosidasius]KJX68613.1 transposase [Parageobacillus thermoglucosidasius]RDE21797.1 transposase [Parageobacillus thermoglucosidasius]